MPMVNRFAVFVVAIAGAVGWMMPTSRPGSPQVAASVERDSPTGLEEIVVAARLVLGGEARMVAAAGTASIGEDQNLLGAAHEGVGFGKVGAG